MTDTTCDHDPHDLCTTCLGQVQPDKDEATNDENFGAEEVGE